MKLSTDVKTLLMIVLVLSVPLAHSLVTAATGDVAGAQTYACNTPGTTTKICDTAPNQPRCTDSKTICKAKAETGNKIFCNNDTGP